MRSSCISKLFVTLAALWCIATIVHAVPDEGLWRAGKVDMAPMDPMDPTNVTPDTTAAVPPPAIGDPLGPGETGPVLDPPTPEEDKKNQVLSCISSCGANFQCSNACITTTYGTGPAPAAQGGPGSFPAGVPPSPVGPAPASVQPPSQPQAPNANKPMSTGANTAGGAHPQGSGGTALQIATGLVGLLTVGMASLLAAF